MTTRTALVTGASRGIGAAVARRLARDGFAVALNSLPSSDMVTAAEAVAEDIRAAGGAAAVYPADIADAAAVDAMVERAVAELGPVHVLVLNAAASARRPWTEVTEDEWDMTAAVNLKGAFLCARRVFGDAPPEGGAVVTVGSVQAELGVADALPYVTTKAGVVGFTRSLARALGPAGVRVNCVLPGAIRTEHELEHYPDQDAVAREVFAVQALRRRGTAEDVAGVVGFLVGSDSAFVTGQTVCVDGGWVLR